MKNVSEEKSSMAFEKMSDETLAELAKDDSTAAAELIARLLPYIKSMSGLMNARISDDLFQEGMLGAISAIDRFDSKKGSAKSFFLKCAKNSMLSAVSRNEMIGSEEDPDEIENVTEEPSVDFGEVYGVIKRCLTEKEQNVIMLYLSGLSYREISRQLHITEKSVDNAMQRARKKLRSEFEGSDTIT